MTPKTAAEVIDQQRHGSRERLARQAADFIRDYRPDDPQEAYDFDMRFQYIQSLIYDIAVEPYQRILTDSVTLASSVSRTIIKERDIA